MKPIRTYACLLGLITASTIFFQFYVSLSGRGLINLNLADPFALLAFAILCLKTVLSREVPRWRVAVFNRILVLFGALLLFGYVIGWMKIGSTQWALSARLIGWVVLLGYLSAGYLVVAYIGNKGIRRLLEVMATVAILVIIWHVVFRLLYGYGFNVPEPTRNFEGFSENRNAFAFQLLAVLALALPYSKVYARQLEVGAKGFYRGWRSWVPVGFLIAGVLWSASRAGMLVAGMMLLVAYYRKFVDRRSTLFGILFAALLWGIVWLLQHPAVIVTPLVTALTFIANAVGHKGQGLAESLAVWGQGLPAPDAAIQSAISGADSNQERLATLLYGFEMWRHSPFIGEGLGVFMANSTEWFGHPTVIHNTLIWILAEFGLLGAIVLGWSFLKLGGYATKSDSSGNSLSRSALLLLLILFIVFSQFHELLFQRIFWLIAGALLGLPLVLGSRISKAE
jgi:hypothetical protein